MKRLIILAFVIGGVFTFNSCTKDELVTNEVSQTANTKPVTEMTDKEVEAKIQAFIAKAESNEKSNETLSLKDAIWNIEAGLNYTFCINDVELIADYDETMEFNITDNNGNVNFNEVANIFNNLKTKTAELKKKAKYISAIDVDEEEGIVSYTISKEISNNKSTELFYIPGNWEWGEKLGDCNGNYYGTQDALLKIRSSITQSELIFPVGTWWSDQSSKGLRSDDYHNPNDIPTTLDNHRDYLLFYRRYSIPNFSTCINNSDVNWYKNNLWSLMNSEIPTGYNPITFINYPNCPYYYINTMGSSYNGILWNNWYKYGIKHYTGNTGM
jgi:hypothetical protein